MEMQWADGKDELMAFVMVIEMGTEKAGSKDLWMVGTKASTKVRQKAAQKVARWVVKRVNRSVY